MQTSIYLIRSIFLLSLALIAPVGLPVGLEKNNKVKIRRNENDSNVFASFACKLKVSPSENSPCLGSIKLSSPLKVLRQWESKEGLQWIHVSSSQVVLSNGDIGYKRGWINV